jgi:hypothetical protein
MPTSQPRGVHGSSAERFPREAPAEKTNFKRHPRFLLKCFAIVVCGSVSLITITASVWAYDRSLQADIRNLFDLEQKLVALEAKLRESEARNAKIIQDCSPVKSANSSTFMLKDKNSTRHENQFEERKHRADRVARDIQEQNKLNSILPSKDDQPW